MTEVVQERRKFTRINFDTAISLKQHGDAYQTKLEDISLNGILVQTPENYSLEADKPIDASITLGDDTDIQMTVILVHSSHDLLGFRCISIDMDSISHLRRLIELNIEDENAADRILNELIELHRQN